MDRATDPVLQSRVTLYKDGRATCKMCGFTWRLTSKKNRNCESCKRMIFPLPYNPYRCHPICKLGLCRALALDFLVCRSTWRAFPKAKGVDWRTDDAVPTNIHDIMLHFKVNKWTALVFFKYAVSCKWVIRVRETVTPPPEIHAHKLKDYFYNRDKCRRTPKGRARRPTFIQYYPTARAMEIFWQRFPENFDKKVTDHGVIWTPIYVDKSKAIVNAKIPLVPLSKLERWNMFLKMSGEKKVDKL